MTERERIINEMIEVLKKDCVCMGLPLHIMKLKALARKENKQ